MFRDIFKKADRKTQGRDAEQRLERKTGRRGMRKFALHFLTCGLVMGAMAVPTGAAATGADPTKFHLRCLNLKIVILRDMMWPFSKKQKVT